MTVVDEDLCTVVDADVEEVFLDEIRRLFHRLTSSATTGRKSGSCVNLWGRRRHSTRLSREGGDGESARKSRSASSLTTGGE